jgi:hypothetical protein
MASPELKPAETILVVDDDPDVLALAVDIGAVSLYRLEYSGSTPCTPARPHQRRAHPFTPYRCRDALDELTATRGGSAGPPSRGEDPLDVRVPHEGDRRLSDAAGSSRALPGQAVHRRRAHGGGPISAERPSSNPLATYLTRKLARTCGRRPAMSMRCSPDRAEERQRASRRASSRKGRCPRGPCPWSRTRRGGCG